MSDQERSMHPNLGDALGAEAAVDPDGPALDALARRLAELGPDDVIEAPPAGLFAAIEAELAGDPTGPSANQVVKLARRPRRRLVVAAVGVAAAVVFVIGLVAVIADGDPEPTTEQIALEGLPAFADVTGSATVVIDGDDRSLGVDLSAVDLPAGSHLELWLLDDSVEQLVPLGTLAGQGPHAIPADVDLTATPVVDVSVEPDDGNPAHSGVSVARGRLSPS